MMMMMMKPENKNIIDNKAEPKVWPVIAFGITVDIAVAKDEPATNIVKTVNTWKKKIAG